MFILCSSHLARFLLEIENCMNLTRLLELIKLKVALFTRVLHKILKERAQTGIFVCDFLCCVGMDLDL